MKLKKYIYNMTSIRKDERGRDRMRVTKLMRKKYKEKETPTLAH